MHLPHPLRIAAGKVVVDRDDMNALSRERFEIGGKRCDERLAFTRLHFGDASLEKTDAADDLHMEMAHSQNAPACLPERRKRIAEDIFERLALLKAILQDPRLRFEFRIGHRRILGGERLDLRRRTIELFQTFAAVTAHEITNKTHKSAPFTRPLLRARARLYYST